MLEDRSEQIKGLKFLFLTLAGAGAIYFLILPLMLPILQEITARISSAFLNVLGVSSRFFAGSPPQVSFNGTKALIEPLCAGDIEISFLVAAILATADRRWRKRIFGAITSFFSVFLVLNPLRISLTLAGGTWFGFKALVFLHSVLFRITLLVSVLGVYAVWYLHPFITKKYKEGSR